MKTFLRSWLSMAVVAGSATLMVACGGGGASSGSPLPPPPSYGGGLTPGSVGLTVTNRVTLTTNYGTIVVGLDATHAPVSTANFLAYVNSGFYNSTLFHRVVPGFVAQGGGYVGSNGNYQPKTNLLAPIGLESRNGLSNTQYTIAMARTSDPNSATSQFYFNLVNNASTLDYPSQDGAGYAVFGTISPTDATSIATLTKISQVALVPSTSSLPANWPATDVVILSAVQTN